MYQHYLDLNVIYWFIIEQVYIYWERKTIINHEILVGRYLLRSDRQLHPPNSRKLTHFVVSHQPPNWNGT